MGQLKWYARDARAALVGMKHLTLEERGAYNTMLDLIYLGDGQIPDNEHDICDWLGTNVRRWRRLRVALIDKGKLYPLNGFLRNPRVDAEMREVNSRAQQHRARLDHQWNNGKRRRH